MAVFFKAGQEGIRPGVYHRYSQVNTVESAGAIDGVCAIAINAKWGPLGEVTRHNSAKSITDTYGNGGTVASAIAMITGGAETVYICRAGSDGAQASLTLKDAAGAEAAKVVALYPGTIEMAIAIQTKISDATKKEFIVYRDGEQVEKFAFAADGAAEPANLAAAAAGSKYVAVTASGTGELAAIDAASGILAGGAEPTVTNEAYVNAWEKLESANYNVIALDTDDDASMTKSLLLKEYIDAAYQTGKLCMAVVGVPSVVPFADRLALASSFNSERFIFLGNGFKDASGNNVEGAAAICLAAGIIAATPANQSITHTVIPAAADTIEKFTNAQYEDAILSGMLMLSTSAEGRVWFDSAVNTLVSPADIQDLGWKKIRRTKTRFEMLDRIDRAVAPKIGKVNADADGISYIRQIGLGVLLDMFNERKIAAGYSMEVDPDYPATSDSVWFIIDAYDIDSLEKIYLHYRFSAVQTNIEAE